MRLPETLLIVLGAAVLMALVLGLLLRSALRAKTGPDDPQTDAAAAELGTLKAANVELGRKLAVEEFRASRLAEVEAAGVEAAKM